MSALDVRIFLFLHDTFSGAWLAPAAVLSAIGGGWGSLFALPLFWSMRTRRMAKALAIVLVSTATLVFVLKQLIGRARPCNCLTDIHARIFAAPNDFSFPSGHASGSFSFCVFFAIILVKTAPKDGPRHVRVLRYVSAALLVLLATAVGLSRISLGVHFPGDVLAGAIVGSTIASLGASYYLRSEGKPAAEVTS